MSEVHRYKVVKMLSEDGNRISYDPYGPEVVLASAFDGATRLFLDAAERCVAAERREEELQQRLTVADERADVLTTAISRIRFSCQSFVEGDWATAVESVEAVLSISGAALKPVESVGSTCNQIREESGLSVSNPCKACNGGACIDR